MPPARLRAWPKLAVGAATGFAAGLLGIGGGAVAVPAMQVVLRLPLRQAIGTSAATILTTAWLGAIVKNAALGADGSVARSLLLAACLAPAAMLGSFLGGHLTHALPLRVVRGAFVVLMLAAAWKMFAP
ncbi:MAG TPA: TSUP family transporter [Smithella sp.]|nr:TSUP family transporter [Smithella sp.]